MVRLKAGLDANGDGQITKFQFLNGAIKSGLWQ